mgnify:CR=1 FL=1
MDWITIIFTSSIVAATSNFILSTIKEYAIYKNDKNRRTELLVTSLAYKMERFSIECGNQICESKCLLTENENDPIKHGKFHNKLPILDIDIENIKWENVDIEFIARINNLFHEILLSNESILSGNEVDWEVGVREHIICSSLIGYKVWLLANELKQKYDIPKLDINTNYNNPIEDILIPEYEKYNQKIK